MAYQYCRNKGDDKRTIFLSFEGDYHGDTMGAMAVSRGSGFFKLFEGLMCEAKTIPFAATFSGDQQREEKERRLPPSRSLINAVIKLPPLSLNP